MIGRQRACAVGALLAPLTIVLLMLVAVGCAQSPASGPSAKADAGPSAKAPGVGQAGPASASFKIGTLPIVDTLPLHVAGTEGLFAKRGLNIELVPFSSAIERDAAIAAGQIDGQLNDLISTGLLNKDSDMVKAVRIAHRATPEMAQISLLVGPHSTVKTITDLRGSEIAISRNSIIEYVTDELLREGGLKEGDVKLTEVSKIPVRVEMLAKGQIGAATLPEPFTSLALQGGARIIASDALSQLGQSVIAFRTEVLSKKAEAVKAFLLAYEDAVDAINANPERYRALLIDRAKVPDAIKDTFRMPRYPKASVPTEAEIEKAMKWMVNKGLLPNTLSYGQMVDGSFLPR